MVPLRSGWTRRRGWALAKGGTKSRRNRQRSTRSREERTGLNGHPTRYRQEDRRVTIMDLEATTFASAPIRFWSLTLGRSQTLPLLHLVDFGACRRASPCEARCMKRRD